MKAWGAPTFRIGKIFAMYAAPDNHHGAGREGIWVKSDHFTQDLLVRGQPMRYFVPPYVGPGGWTGVYLDGRTDWIALADFLRDAYRATAPKRLAALLADETADHARLGATVRKKPAEKPAKKPAKRPAKRPAQAPKR